MDDQIFAFPGFPVDVLTALLSVLLGFPLDALTGLLSTLLAGFHLVALTSLLSTLHGFPQNVLTGLLSNLPAGFPLDVSTGLLPTFLVGFFLDVLTDLLSTLHAGFSLPLDVSTGLLSSLLADISPLGLADSPAASPQELLSQGVPACFAGCLLAFGLLPAWSPGPSVPVALSDESDKHWGACWGLGNS